MFVMKKTKYQVLVFILLATIPLIFSACGKHKAKKNIEGIWKFHSGTGFYSSSSVKHSGTWEFKIESGAKGKLIKNWTKEYNGEIVSEEINEVEDFEIVDHGFIINIGIVHGYFLDVNEDTLKISLSSSSYSTQDRVFVRL